MDKKCDLNPYPTFKGLFICNNSLIKCENWSEQSSYFVENNYESYKSVVRENKSICDSIIWIMMSTSSHIYDGVHPKTSPFSTPNLIWVNYKVLSQLSQLIFVLFLYLNSALHNLVIKLCRALNIF